MTTEWLLPEVDLSICTRCGRCVDRCPEDAVVLTEAGPIFVRPEACTYCGICETVCPEGAIQLSYVITWDPGVSSRETAS
ncbi:MAG: 4Fe-4S binding protein [Anaerolineae bacterium]|nr:4Fe-4S binding protein [Anaerolineae bacterium]